MNVLGTADALSQALRARSGGRLRRPVALRVIARSGEGYSREGRELSPTRARVRAGRGVIAETGEGYSCEWQGFLTGRGDKMAPQCN